MAVGDLDLPLTGWQIVQPAYRGNPRYFLIQRCYIFKKVRTEGGIRVLTEMANELVCNLLGARLGIPLVPTFIGVLPEHGIGLCSVLLGERCFDPNDEALKGTLTNLSKLKDLFVFDQWIYNDDRRADHIMVGVEPTNPNAKVLYGYDHGHTLNGYMGQKWTIESFTEGIAKMPSPVLFDSGIQSLGELTDAIVRINSLQDIEIERAVDAAIFDLVNLKMTQAESHRVEQNALIVKAILQKRKQCLQDIVKSWLQAAGKQI